MLPFLLTVLSFCNGYWAAHYWITKYKAGNISSGLAIFLTLAQTFGVAMLLSILE